MVLVQYINMSHMPQILIRFVPLLFDRFIPQYNFAYVYILNITSHGFLYSTSILHTHTLQHSYYLFGGKTYSVFVCVRERERNCFMQEMRWMKTVHFTLCKNFVYGRVFAHWWNHRIILVILCPLFSVHFVSAFLLLFIAFY